MTPLCEIALRYGTDKVVNGYTPFYYRLLCDRRNSIKKVLEIGIGTTRNMHKMPGYQTGASLRTWRDFFSNAHVFGADRDPEAMFEDERITTVLCDQRSRWHLDNLLSITGPDVDLFIDDAWHGGKTQISTCLHLMPTLAKGVIYVIEDVADPEDLASHLRNYGYQCQSIRFGRKRCNIVVVKHEDTV